MSNEYVEKVAQAIIKQLQDGTAPWVKPWLSGASYFPYNPASGNNYRGMNAMWLMSVEYSKGYSDHRWMTYRQASELGAQVNKGEHGTLVQYWKWQDTRPVTDAQGTPALGDDGQAKRETVQLDRFCVFNAVVFNAEQMTGLPPAAAGPVPQPRDRQQRAEVILTASQAQIRHVAGDRAYYNLASDTIMLPQRDQFSTPDRYYGTALHELGHWSGTANRLARDMAHPFGSEGYAKEELRAEIGSLMLGEQLGIGHDPGQHAAYVKNWIKVLQDDPREIFRAAADAEKIAKYVFAFEQTHEQQVGHQQEQHDMQVRGAALATDEQVGTKAADSMEQPAPRVAAAKTYLAVPYAQKEAAKAKGAKWDRLSKAWYVNPGADLAPFAKWRRDQAETKQPDPHPLKEFVPALTEADRARLVAEATQHREERDRQRAATYAAAAVSAASLWETTTPATQHAYLDRKGVQPHGLALATQDTVDLADRLFAQRDKNPFRVGSLVVPAMAADGTLASLQTITADGRKSFMPNGQMIASRLMLGVHESGQAVMVAEGYATAASLHEATGYPVAVAFNAGNLAAVAKSLRERDPNCTLIVAGDNDRRLEHRDKPHTGKTMAEDAAKQADGLVMLPTFGAEQDGKDWNDVAQHDGPDQVRAELEQTLNADLRKRLAQGLGKGLAGETEDHENARQNLDAGLLEMAQQIKKAVNPPPERKSAQQQMAQTEKLVQVQERELSRGRHRSR